MANTTTPDYESPLKKSRVCIRLGCINLKGLPLNNGPKPVQISKST